MAFMASWLILGGSGFIGSAVARCNPAEFVVADNSESADVRLDLETRTGLADLDQLIGEGGFDGIVWALPPIACSGHLRTLVFRHCVPRLVVLSSALVYGEYGERNGPVSEATLTNPVGIGKLWKQVEDDLLAVAQSPLFRPKVAVLRLFNVSGFNPFTGFIPRGDVIARALAVAATNETFFVHSDRSHVPVRDFMHVMDVSIAVLQVMALLQAGEDVPRVANLARGKPTTILDVLNHARKITGMPIHAKFAGANSGVTELWCRGTALDGITPPTSFSVAEIVEDMWRNYGSV